MADVKTLTVHGIPYSIKDETARNNIGTLQSTVSRHTSDISEIKDDVSTLQSTVSGHTSDISEIEGDVSTLQSTVSGHTTKISTIDGEIDTLQSTVSGHTDSISSINSTLGTKITGDWFFDNHVSQTDLTVPKTPTYVDIYSGNFNNSSGGAYLVTVTGLLFQGGQGNIEIMASIDNNDTLIGNIPANENLIYANCTGVVSFPPGDHNIKIKARATNGSAVAKAYASIFVTLVKIKNV